MHLEITSIEHTDQIEKEVKEGQAALKITCRTAERACTHEGPWDGYRIEKGLAFSGFQKVEERASHWRPQAAEPEEIQPGALVKAGPVVLVGQGEDRG